MVKGEAIVFKDNDERSD